MKHALLALLFAACGGSSSPAPQAPADKPPLPPASGTPIGYLIDDASELHLRDDQLAQLRQLDTQLAADLDAIDTHLRAAQPQAAPQQAPPQMGGGRHRGGGGRRRGGGGQSQAPRPAPTGDPAAADKLTEQRRADVKDALAKAFTVLDADQQPVAKKLLQEHDVDLDDSAPHGPAANEATDDEAAP
jgi:hypothetical protein